MSRVELFERIRRDRRLDPQVSVRMLAERYEVHRRTVRQALDSALPPQRKKPPPRRLLLEPAMGWIDEMLREDLASPRKQRHTIERIYQRLRFEYDFDGASYSTVRDYVNARRPQIVTEERDGAPPMHVAGMVPQIHLPGEEAEVDFAEVWVRLAGTALKCHLFTLRMSYSGKAVHRVFASQSQEAFMEGHVEAFRVLGGVPTRHIRYDNLKPAVNQVCFGRTRVESQRWVAFRSHYGFEPFYCLPGKEGAHEKGGVEHEGGRFRRTHLVPVPEVASLAELNATIAEIDAREDARHVHGHPTSIGFNFAIEAEVLGPVPGEEFDTGLTLTPKVGRDSRIVVRQGHYSVPARFIGRRVRVSLRANDLLVFDGPTVIARHARLITRYDYHDELDHYLEILLTKPGALAGSAALAQARGEGSFTPIHEAFWAAARTKLGDAAGTRALIEVLLLHRRMDTTAVLAGVSATLQAGSTSTDLVAIEARKAAADLRDSAQVAGEDPDPDADQACGEESRAASAGAAVITLASGRPLPDDNRPLPSVAIYDQLLTRQPKGTP
ncbi:MAG: IS21 family transposase [Pseudonocardiaceae bacterium]